MSDHQRETEQWLHRLRPMAAGIDPQQVFLETVRRATQRQVWLWRGVAAALAAGLVLSLLLRSSPRPPSHKEFSHLAEPTPARPMLIDSLATEPRLAVEGNTDLLWQPGTNYLSVRNRVLALGLRAMPAASPWAPPPVSESHPRDDHFGPLSHGVRS